MLTETIILLFQKIVQIVLIIVYTFETLKIAQNLSAIIFMYIHNKYIKSVIIFM